MPPSLPLAPCQARDYSLSSRACLLGSPPMLGHGAGLDPYRYVRLDPRWLDVERNAPAPVLPSAALVVPICAMCGGFQPVQPFRAALPNSCSAAHPAAACMPGPGQAAAPPSKTPCGCPAPPPARGGVWVAPPPRAQALAARRAPAPRRGRGRGGAIPGTRMCSARPAGPAPSPATSSRCAAGAGHMAMHAGTARLALGRKPTCPCCRAACPAALGCQPTVTRQRCTHTPCSARRSMWSEQTSRA